MANKDDRMSVDMWFVLVRSKLMEDYTLRKHPDPYEAAIRHIGQYVASYAWLYMDGKTPADAVNIGMGL